ncbi:DUF1292 domain-containing protein [Kosmotoga pacifica]|uniref:DUF1292 domain-containing protein n=1 Tax=Kosmotoga pacifica TaxID=1330330 RepID=A0A0G2Z9J2_9BACT|nr:DUF1292 domain-containing protein [Kosmotoga pacifica]AKI96756.1 hypothetical protein IX53_01765 [Kosmotoga pacifica]
MDELKDFGHLHEHEHEHHYEMFAISDEDGNEHNFALITQLDVDDKRYWVCQEAFVEGEEVVGFDEDSYVVFRASEDENGNVILNSLDDEEFEKVSKAWDEELSHIVGEEEEETEK